MSAKKENELVLTRLYDAPVEMVWDAWTDPEQVAKWWGPRGFTITTHSKELRPGGTWVYTMHGPDGKDWPNLTTYFQVEKYKLLEYDHGASEGNPPLFRVLVTFKDVKGKTQMDMKMTFESPERAKEIAVFIKQAGGNSTWDRLAEYLSEEKGEKKFVINRSFPVSIGTMYKMWTDPNHFSKWLPPTGFRMEFITAEIREGGETFYKMTNDKDVTMYGKSRYQELTPVTRIVYQQEFCDENGKQGRHPLAPLMPAYLLTKVLLCEEGPNETRVTVSMEPVGDVTQEEMDFFMNSRPGMTMGWTGSFEKLENLLTEAR